MKTESQALINQRAVVELNVFSLERPFLASQGCRRAFGPIAIEATARPGSVEKVDLHLMLYLRFAPPPGDDNESAADRNVLETCLRLAGDEDEHVRAGACQKLGHLALAEAEQTLLEAAANDRSPYVRQMAMQAIDVLKTPRVTTEALGGLQVRLTDVAGTFGPMEIKTNSDGRALLCGVPATARCVLELIPSERDASAQGLWRAEVYVLPVEAEPGWRVHTERVRAQPPEADVPAEGVGSAIYEAWLQFTPEGGQEIATGDYTICLRRQAGSREVLHLPSSADAPTSRVHFRRLPAGRGKFVAEIRPKEAELTFSASPERTPTPPTSPVFIEFSDYPVSAVLETEGTGTMLTFITESEDFSKRKFRFVLGEDSALLRWEVTPGGKEWCSLHWGLKTPAAEAGEVARGLRIERAA